MAPAPPQPAPYPSSATPYPASAAPYPASAAPYPASGSPYPASAAPYGMMPPPAPKRGPWVIVLSILSGVLFLAAGGAGALYYTDHDKSTKAAAEQQAQIDDLRGQLDKAQADFEDLSGDFADLEEDAAACSDAAEKFLNADADPSLSQSELERLISGLVLELIRACEVTIST